MSLRNRVCRNWLAPSALALGLLNADASRATEIEATAFDSAVEEMVLVTPWRLQQRGELQTTAAFTRGRVAESLEAEFEVEFGLVDWLQAGLEAELTPFADQDPEVAVGVLFAPWRSTSSLRLALGAVRHLDAADESAMGAFALFGFVARPVEFHLDAGVDREGEETFFHAAAGVALARKGWSALMEFRGDFLESTEFAVSPGVAWHPREGLEITIGAPLRFTPDAVSAAGVLKLSAEFELLP